jgi:hypothetical protein
MAKRATVEPLYELQLAVVQERTDQAAREVLRERFCVGIEEADHIASPLPAPALHRPQVGLAVHLGADGGRDLARPVIRVVDGHDLIDNAAAA